MDIKELLLLALEALKRNLVRTMLTMLGIIIGIGSVITVISLGEGTTASIVEQISSFGANVITISPGQSKRGGGSASTVTTLVEEDGEAIMNISNVVAVSGVVSKNKTVTANGESDSVSIKGVEENYDEIQSLEIEAGLFFDEGQESTSSRVAVMGDEVVEELFGVRAQVIGETIRIDLKSFRVVGVMNESSEVLIPLSTAQNILFGQDHLDSISVAVVDSELVDGVMSEVEEVLLLEHEIDDML